MPIMPIPRHRPLDARAVAARLKECLQSQSVFKGRLFHENTPLPGYGGDRLTRVPFLKWVLEGAITVPASEPDAGTALTPGDFALFAPNSFVAVEFDQPCAFLRITVESDGLLIGFEQVNGETNATTASSTLQPAGQLDACWCVGSPGATANELLAKLLTDDPLSPPHRASLAQSYLWEIQQWLQGDQLPTAGRADRTTEILHYLRDQCHRPINRKTTARALGISEGHLGRLVKQHTGRDFRAHLTELRMETARWLLKHTALPIQEIARRSGYTSANYFNQAFKAHCGSPPGAWLK